MKKGYYWIKFKDEPEEETIGYYEGDNKSYPWQVVGSDEIFQGEEIIILRRVK